MTAHSDASQQQMLMRCVDGQETDQTAQMLLQQLHEYVCINDTGPLYGQRLQTRVLRIDPNVLMMLQLSRTHHSSLPDALSTAAPRPILL